MRLSPLSSLIDSGKSSLITQGNQRIDPGRVPRLFQAEKVAQLVLLRDS